MVYYDRYAFFEHIAETITSEFAHNNDLSLGGERVETLRKTLRAAARFCRLSYKEAEIDERVAYLKQPYKTLLDVMAVLASIRKVSVEQFLTDNPDFCDFVHMEQCFIKETQSSGSYPE